jgi:hypothetical protein
MPGLSDTSPEVERLMAEAYRRMPVWHKVRQVADAYMVARRMHAAGCRLRNPAATDGEINRAWVLMAVGDGPWMSRMEFDAMTQPADVIQQVRAVTSILNDLGIPYAIGGSLASSVHGYSRYTFDADLTVEPFPGREQEFVSRFPAAEYYADEAMVRDAVARRSTFNILHLRTSFKTDLFVRKDRPFEVAMFGRRFPAPVFGPTEGLFEVITPEDTVLLKLEWYRIGGEISDRQWNDILGVMRTQAGRLDDAYLDHWAADIGVKDLLDRIRGEV